MCVCKNADPKDRAREPLGDAMAASCGNGSKPHQKSTIHFSFVFSVCSLSLKRGWRSVAAEGLSVALPSGIHFGSV